MVRRIVIGLLVLALAALVIGGIFKAYESWRTSVRAEGFRAGQQDTQSKWDDERNRLAADKLAQVAEDNLESKRRMALQERNRAESERERATALADARAARAESLRLSEWADGQVAIAAAANRGGADRADGQQCQAAGAAAGMLAHVLKQLDERAGILAEYADRARLAGLQCQRDYEALTLKATVLP